MLKRTISGVIIAILAFAVCLPGGDILLATMAACSAVGVYEIFKVFGMQKSLPGIVGYFFLALYYINIKFSFIDDKMSYVVSFLIVLLCAYVITYSKYKIDQILAIFFAVFYVGVMASYIYFTRMLNNGVFYVVLVFLSSWICDTCAYFSGVKLGKHKMCPNLSPKKSWEGAIGGVLGSMIVTAIYLYFARDYMGIMLPAVAILTVIDGIACIFSMMGDLTASAIKRNYDIKDFGNVIPGHGGIMDRFDSIIFTAPIIYYLCYYFM